MKKSDHHQHSSGAHPSPSPEATKGSTTDHRNHMKGSGEGGHGSKDHNGHDKHAGHSPAMFREKFWLSLILTLPVVFWSAHIQALLGYQAPEFLGSDWIPTVLGTVVYFYGGWVFIQGAWRELREILPGMMTLISLSITVACRRCFGVRSTEDRCGGGIGV